MFHHRKEFDVREADLEKIFDELSSQFAIGERTVAVLGNPPPRTKVHLIYSYWRPQRIAAIALGHPGTIVK